MQFTPPDGLARPPRSLHRLPDPDRHRARDPRRPAHLQAADRPPPAARPFEVGAAPETDRPIALERLSRPHPPPAATGGREQAIDEMTLSKLGVQSVIQTLLFRTGIL